MKISPAYVLAGPETGKRSAFITELKGAFQKQTGQEPECHRLYSADVAVAELVLLLRNGSLFSPGRMVEYRGAEAIKGKADLGELRSYLAAPSGDAVLLLVTEAFSIEKSLEEAVGKDCKKTFFEMFENEKNRWVESKLTQFGLSIDADGLETLLELVENESGALETACLGLAAGFPAGTTLGEAEVEAAVARNRHEDAFTLFERIAQSEPDTALGVLDAVLADRQGGAVPIISALVWNFRRLIKLHVLIGQGMNFESACFKLAIRSKTVQRQNQAAVKRYSRAECERIITLASTVDGMVRSMGTAFERQLLHFLVYGIMIKKGNMILEERAGAFL